MNKVFIIVKIIEYKYYFSINKKQNAICTIKGRLLNESLINLQAFNSQADKCLRIIQKEKTYMVCGYLNSNMEVIIEDIEKIFY